MKLNLKYNDGRKVFEEKEKGGVPFLSFPLLEGAGFVRQGFSTRLGGVSTGGCSSMNISTTRGDDREAILENRVRIANALGTRWENFTYTRQTHTVNVARVTKEDRGTQLDETDGMITDEPGICLVTFYADCVPLYFVDPVHRAIGLSHSGWRGTVNRMAQVTLKKMAEEFGTDPADVLAAIGPSICQSCYEVDDVVINRFRETFSEDAWPELFFQKENGKYQLNLWAANARLMLEGGIKEENLAVTNLCTCCNSEYLFSHRAMGENRGNLCAFMEIKYESR